jgi:ACS family glucarate transporter-like MFS transporter
MPKQAAPDGGQALPWSVILGSRNVWALTVSYFAFGYVSYIFFTWFFIYLNRVRGLDLKASAIFGMLPFLAMATFSPLGGYISDRLTKRYGKRVGRCGISVVSMAVAAGFIVFAMQAHDARVASIVLAGGAGALYLSTSCFWSVTADIAGRSAGSVSGVMNMGNQIGGTVTASLTPVLASAFGWPSSFLVAAALCLLGSLAWLLVDPYRILSRRALEDVIETTR